MSVYFLVQFVLSKVNIVYHHGGSIVCVRV